MEYRCWHLRRQLFLRPLVELYSAYEKESSDASIAQHVGRAAAVCLSLSYPLLVKQLR